MFLSRHHIIAAVLLIVYLLFPATAHVNAYAQHHENSVSVVSSSAPSDVPAKDSPCSGGMHDSGCCDTNSCSCSCHLPLTLNSLQIAYSPLISMQRFSDLSWYLPQVYLTIFIPPQNNS